MINWMRDIEKGYEFRFGDTCVGATDAYVGIYNGFSLTRFKGGQGTAPLEQLNNCYGSKLDIEFMWRHQLPATLQGFTGLFEYVVPSQLPRVLYLFDRNTDRYYMADSNHHMDKRHMRRHYVVWQKSSLDYVTPDQKIIKAIQVTDNKLLKDYKKWHAEFLKTEEAIKVLEPDYEKNKLAKILMFTDDLSKLMAAAYKHGRSPGSVLADISDRNYYPPKPEEVGVGTTTKWFTWLTKA